jgi:hypothetical protein
MISVRVPPTLPATPMSHPLMTGPAPSLNENGLPRSRELSNFLQLVRRLRIVQPPV